MTERFKSHSFCSLTAARETFTKSQVFCPETGSEGVCNLSNSSSLDCRDSNILLPGSSHCREEQFETYSNHLLPLLSQTVTAWVVLAGELGYMAASNLMSLHMLPQQSKVTPAVLIPVYWPSISGECRCRGLHPEKLKQQKQVDQRTPRGPLSYSLNNQSIVSIIITIY